MRSDYETTCRIEVDRNLVEKTTLLVNIRISLNFDRSSSASYKNKESYAETFLVSKLRKVVG